MPKRGHVGSLMPSQHEVSAIINYIEPEEDEINQIPEMALIRACLMRTISDATGNTGVIGKKAAERAQLYAIASILASAPERPFSFEWMCHALDRDPAVLRRYVLETRTPFKKPRTHRRGHLKKIE